MVEKARETLGEPSAEVRTRASRAHDAASPVDAVFSNAVFHWIPDHDRALRRQPFDALEPGGRLEAQCGGAGKVIEQFARQRSVRRPAAVRPAYFEAGAARGTSPADGARPRGSRRGLHRRPLLARGLAGDAAEPPSTCARSCLGPTSSRLPDELRETLRRAAWWTRARRPAASRVRAPQHLRAEAREPHRRAARRRHRPRRSWPPLRGSSSGRRVRDRGASRRRRLDRRARHRADRRGARRLPRRRRRAAGAVGGPKWDTTDPDAPRPEQGLLGLRKELGLFANLRPVRPSPALLDASPLQRERIEGTDLLVVRELTGGIYFGERGRATDGGRAYDTCVYTDERDRADRAGRLPLRAPRVTSVDKANILETSRLWREVVERVAAEHDGPSSSTCSWTTRRCSSSPRPPTST